MLRVMSPVVCFPGALRSPTDDIFLDGVESQPAAGLRGVVGAGLKGRGGANSSLMGSSPRSPCLDIIARVRSKREEWWEDIVDFEYREVLVSGIKL